MSFTFLFVHSDRLGNVALGHSESLYPLTVNAEFISLGNVVLGHLEQDCLAVCKL